MLRWLKKHFIPHEGNDHQPHFLRDKNIRILVGIVFVIELGILLLPFIPALNLMDNRFTAAVLPSVLDDLTNQNRQAQHLAVLTVSPVLNKVAEMKAKDMAENSYFAHVSPDGKTPWYWFKEVGYDYEYAGENLAVDFTDSEDVVVAWMNSPTHRANIVKNAYTEVGTGIATGTYQGRPTIFVAQEYGRPVKVAVVEKPIVVEKTVAPEGLIKETNEPVQVVVNETVGVVSTSTKVLGEEAVTADVKPAPIPAQTYVKTNIFEKFAVSPRHTANIIFAVISALVGLALLLKLFIRMDKRHPSLITNGLIVLVLIFGVYSVNNYVVKAKMATTTSFISFQGEQPFSIQ